MLLDTSSQGSAPRATLVDGHGRSITYVRVSVTDRCDYRCTYCMPEGARFLPREEVLSIEELDRLCTALVRRGVTKLRITGGEPLMRRDVMELFASLSRHVRSGALRELTLTTNGSQLARHADRLSACGVRRVNVSLDSLDPDRFAAVTRRGRLRDVLEGIAAARGAGLQVKVNVVAMRGVNEDEVERLVTWAHGDGMDITFIEVMPLGEERHGPDVFLPLDAVRARLARAFTLDPIPFRTGGPARYVGVRETGGRVGFITPLTHGFCETCNRVRVTCTGTLYMCLGQHDATDLRAPLRASSEDGPLMAALDDALSRKPMAHNFVADRNLPKPRIGRTMSVTGG